MQVRGQILFICVDFDFLKLFCVNLFISIVEFFGASLARLTLGPALRIIPVCPKEREPI